MRAFVVPAGTDVKVVKEGKEWYPDSFERITTTEESMFFLEDIEIDPLGHVGIGPNGNSVGARLAQNGYYGFKLKPNSKKYAMMLVPLQKIKVY